MGIESSILKEILRSKNCSVSKYLSPMSCNFENGAFIEYYITPLVTETKKNVLIVSKVINGNWYEAVTKIGCIVKNIRNVYKFKLENYTVILHAYFEPVELEKFYHVDPADNYLLNKLKLGEFENLLL